MWICLVVNFIKKGVFNIIMKVSDEGLNCNAMYCMGSPYLSFHLIGRGIFYMWLDGLLTLCMKEVFWEVFILVISFYLFDRKWFSLQVVELCTLFWTETNEGPNFPLLIQISGSNEIICKYLASVSQSFIFKNLI